ncbi:MAG: helix-turn-helix domain-containing protein [Candidatus Gracilibacteria bacterium]|jgi:sugar-specific transcriptional regulator TrmB
MLTATDLSRIVALLKQFECNESEAKIYVESLKTGPTTVQELAKKMKRNRVTVHSAVEQLVEKGLLYETRKENRRLIGAEEPDILHRLLQKRENEMKLLKSNLDYVTGLLNSVQAVDKSIPTVKFYEGLDGFKKMLEETLTARGKVFVFTYVDLFSKLLGPEYLEDYFVRRAKKGIYTRLIFPPCAFATRVNKKAKEYNIEVRLLPPELQWKSGIFSWNDSMSLMSYTEGKLTNTIIENKDIAYFYQNVIFELCWAMAKPM